MDGSTPLGSPVPLISGTATYVTSALSLGSHSITVVYSGDSNLTGGSRALRQIVRKARTKTVLLSYPNPADGGELVTFVAFVWVVAPGTVTPSGTVTFKEGTTTLGTAGISDGVAIFTTDSLMSGTHLIRAFYGGDSNSNTSASSVVIQVVT